MKRLLAILLWSVLAAAFIGPGTVTTAAKAGHAHGLRLLWTFTFSIIACVVLQEAAARITVVSGDDLGRAIRRRFTGTVWLIPALLLVVLAILVGCAAYEMGNILGAAAGLALVVDLSPRVASVCIGALAALLLWFGSVRTVARWLGAAVAVMGVAFLVTAFELAPDGRELLRGACVPQVPAGSSTLVLALIGTTVVPYNLFLGSRLAAGQELADLRIGIVVAVVLGGLISMAVLVVGTAIVGEFGYEPIAQALELRLASWARPMFALGLFAAGLSSAITAPLAAALTAQSLFGASRQADEGERSLLYRGTWLGVLATGVVCGAVGVKPIPAIILAQATNGVLLPLVALFLLLLVNDRQTMGERGCNGWRGNLLLGAVVLVTLVLGGSNGMAALTSLLR